MLTIQYERLQVEPGMRMLDLGCGGGRHSFEALKSGADVISADLDDAVLKDVTGLVAAMRAEGQIGSVGHACIRADALDLPFPDDAFDRVIASEILEHIELDQQALTEIARVLRPGGIMAASVPRWWPELINWGLSREYRNNPGGHVRIYRRGQLVDRLDASGLRLEDSHHAHSLHTPYWWLRSLVGIGREDARVVSAYHRFLVWDIEHPRSILGQVERGMDPIAGKSLVLYARKPA